MKANFWCFFYVSLGLNACTKPQECAIEDVWARNTEYITPASSFTLIRTENCWVSCTQPTKYFIVK